MSEQKVTQLLKAVEDVEQISIVPHNNPDPDAIASAVALSYILKTQTNTKGEIAYKGIIGRAENRALVRYLDTPFKVLNGLELSTPLALIDTQPGAGNTPFPVGQNLAIIIDHHRRLKSMTQHKAGFVDIRSTVGATATILTEYLIALHTELPPALITALFYGIKTNTLGLGRNTSLADAKAYYYLQPKIDVTALTRIENAKVPLYYFRSFDAALRAARIYEGVVISFLGDISYPDLTAEMADLLLRLEEAHWVVCLGIYEDALILSVRTRLKKQNAEQLAQTAVGEQGVAGGHGTIAGGQIPLQGQSVPALVDHLTRQLLQTLEIAPSTVGRPLI